MVLFLTSRNEWKIDTPVARRAMVQSPVYHASITGCAQASRTGGQWRPGGGGGLVARRGWCVARKSYRWCRGWCVVLVARKSYRWCRGWCVVLVARKSYRWCRGWCVVLVGASRTGGGGTGPGGGWRVADRVGVADGAPEMFYILYRMVYGVISQTCNT